MIGFKEFLLEAFRSDIDKKYTLHWHMHGNDDFKLDTEKGPKDHIRPPMVRNSKRKIHKGSIQTVPAGHWDENDPWKDDLLPRKTSLYSWRGWMGGQKSHATALDISKTKRKTFDRTDCGAKLPVETVSKNDGKIKQKKTYTIWKAIDMDARLAKKREAHKKFIKDRNGS